MESMEFLASPDTEPVHNPGIFQTVRVETDTLPPLVELGRKLLVKAQEGDAEAVKDLMRHGAPFTTDWLGTSAIHWACQLNHVEVVEVLLKAGISRDARNKVDRTPLHVTAQEGHINVLKLLLEHGVDVDAVDMLRMTPLHWAAEYGHEECVRLLLENGADPEAVNKFDKTPDQIAFDNNRLDITHVIQEYAENPLRHMRRKLAKEKQKQAAAAHKAALENKVPTKIGFNGEKSPKQQGDLKEVRILKLPKRRAQAKMVLEKNLKPINNILTADQVNEDSQPLPDENNTDKTLAMLQAHGITMLPTDESTIVASAMQSGQKIVLTEAGKMALNLTQKPMAIKPQMTLPVKGLIKLPELLKGKKVITIKADQLINMKNERKVIIQTDRKFKPSTFQSQPKTVQNKPKVEVLVKKTTVNNKTHLTSSYIHRLEDTEASDRLTDEVSEREVTRTDETELDRIKQELDRTKRELKALQEQYSKKEMEAEEYKRILEMLKSDK